MTYTMFPELVDEFGTERYPAESLILLEEDLDENDNIEWTFEEDWPYGEYVAELQFRQANAVEGEDGFEFKDLPEAIKYGGSDK